jgi:toxin ParE1/3/4
MIVRWSTEATKDLASLRAYIEKDNPGAAKKTATLILKSVDTLLVENPRMGRPGRVPGTRELVIKGTPYIVPYRLQGRVIQVLGVYHGARRWPESF